MKKIATLAISAMVFSAPALAGTMTISFANDDGTTTVMTFDDATMTATAEGVEGSFAYTWDADANAICGDPTGEGEVCATFAEKSDAPAVGTTSAYTLSTGGGGTATVTALSE